MTAKFLHTADWQLGKPFQRVSDDIKRGRLQNERIACLRRIGETARDSKASFVLVAGDLFDSPSPLKSTVSQACEAIGAIKIPVLAIPGNHDHGGPGSLWEQPFFVSEREKLAPNLRVLLEAKPVVLENAVVFPAPLLRRHESTDPTAWIRTAFDAPEFPADLPRIVLAHGSVQGFESAQDDEDEDIRGLNRIDLGRLPDHEIDYIALGDWHGTKQISAKAWYSGTPEIDRFPRGSDNDPGNILLVEATRHQAPQVETKHTGQFRWNEFAHRFSEDAGFEAFDTALQNRIGEWSQDSLLKLSLSGSLGIETSRRLEELVVSLEARLLRVKLDNQVAIAPTNEEIQALANRPDDPLIRSVAEKLTAALVPGEQGDIARLALRELHAALR
jgi:DNA repair exonuclease SbcCD nuclease subunit